MECAIGLIIILLFILGALWVNNKQQNNCTNTTLSDIKSTIQHNVSHAKYAFIEDVLNKYEIQDSILLKCAASNNDVIIYVFTLISLSGHAATKDWYADTLGAEHQYVEKFSSFVYNGTGGGCSRVIDANRKANKNFEMAWEILNRSGHISSEYTQGDSGCYDEFYTINFGRKEHANGTTN